MKGFKPYSCILLLLSILLVVLSFYMMDIIPLLYEFYMGDQIVASKMDKLFDFELKVRHELQLYGILLLLTSLFLYFIRTLKHYFILIGLALLIHFVFIAEVTDYAIFNRFYQMFLTLPLLWIFFDFFKFKKETYQNKITHAFLFITLLCIVLPGLYLPPFFSGIQGWTAQIDKGKIFPIDGVYLVRNDGKEIRFSRAIVSPINFVTRLNTYMERTNPHKLNSLLRFYQEVYKKRYKTLEKGRLPTQIVFGKFAYPIHNPPGDFDYSKFPPSRIKEIKISRKYYAWDKKFIKEEIIAKEDWK